MKKSTIKMIRILNIVTLLCAFISIVFAIVTKERKWIDITVILLLSSEQSRNILLQDELEKMTNRTRTK
nr:MAG TPA: hypothetical protein [Caudoviricetes sp.]